ncbi:hypothetical protein Anapl_16242 [Anas platyrhynchos]|uniref:Uncharacterized protein n=1 Tax=Anas platyrhynchos TaxID=8839 RepID=R0JW27_ANAPL|nr:hypothetical protein Anapl_16242 [Anas platyrhynchos]
MCTRRPPLGAGCGAARCQSAQDGGMKGQTRVEGTRMQGADTGTAFWQPALRGHTAGCEHDELPVGARPARHRCSLHQDGEGRETKPHKSESLGATRMAAGIPFSPAQSGGRAPGIPNKLHTDCSAQRGSVAIVIRNVCTAEKSSHGKRFAFSLLGRSSGQVPAHMGAPSLSLCFHLPVPIPAAPPEEGRHGWGCVGHGAPLLAVLPDLVLLRVAAAGRLTTPAVTPLCLVHVCSLPMQLLLQKVFWGQKGGLDLAPNTHVHLEVHKSVLGPRESPHRPSGRCRDPRQAREPPAPAPYPRAAHRNAGQRRQARHRHRHSARGWRAAMQGTRPVLVFHYQDSANKTRLFSCELENRRGHYLVKLLVALFLSLRVSPCLGHFFVWSLYVFLQGRFVKNLQTEKYFQTAVALISFLQKSNNLINFLEKGRSLRRNTANENGPCLQPKPLRKGTGELGQDRAITIGHEESTACPESQQGRPRALRIFGACAPGEGEQELVAAAAAGGAGAKRSPPRVPATQLLNGAGAGGAEPPLGIEKSTGETEEKARRDMFGQGTAARCRHRMLWLQKAAMPSAAGAALWKLLGLLPPATKPTCQHMPLLDKAPTGAVTSSQYQLWGASTGSHQGSGWLSFSDVPLHCEGADDILLGSRGIGTYRELQDSRCSALVENSARCYIGKEDLRNLSFKNLVTVTGKENLRSGIGVSPKCSGRRPLGGNCCGAGQCPSFNCPIAQGCCEVLLVPQRVPKAVCALMHSIASRLWPGLCVRMDAHWCTRRTEPSAVYWSLHKGTGQPNATTGVWGILRVRGCGGVDEAPGMKLLELLVLGGPENREGSALLVWDPAATVNREASALPTAMHKRDLQS